MTAYNNECWNPDDEAAIDVVVHHDADLQQRIDEHVQEDNLFDAGMLTFEHAILLARLKQSPAARHIVSTALHYALNDMKLSAEDMHEDYVVLSNLALELSVDDMEFDPFIDILVAKKELRDAIDDGEEIPHSLVYRLGAAYLSEAEKLPQSTKYETGYYLVNKYDTGSRKRTKRQTIGIQTSVGKVLLSHSAASFDRAIDDANTIEKLHLFKPDDDTVTIQCGPFVSKGHKLRCMANELLSLPDEPEFTYESELPNMDIFESRADVYNGLQNGVVDKDSVFNLATKYVSHAPPRLVSKKKSKHRSEEMTSSQQSAQVCVVDPDGWETIIEVISTVRTYPAFVSGFGTANRTYVEDKSVKLENKHGKISFNITDAYKNEMHTLARLLMGLPASPSYVKPNRELHKDYNLERFV